MKKIFIFIISLLFASQLFALEVPSLTGRVVDKAGILDSSQESEITNYLRAVEESSGAQIAVLTIDSLEGDSLEMFSYKTAKKWALGESDKDNGVLLLVAVSERKLRIEVGYGLEGVLTDATSGYIIRNVITPSFKNGDYGKGILDGVKAMGGLISGEISSSQYEEKQSISRRSFNGGRSWFGIIIFLIIMAVKVIFFSRGIFLGGTGRYYRHNSGSSFTGGGFSGGGFSGGGGGFGGGGASGGW